MQLGTILSLLVCPGIIRAYDWPSVFYIFGATGFVWLLAWLPFAKDRAQLPDSKLLPDATAQLKKRPELGNSASIDEVLQASNSSEGASSTDRTATGKEASTSASDTLDKFDFRTVRGQQTWVTECLCLSCSQRCQHGRQPLPVMPTTDQAHSCIFAIADGQQAPGITLRLDFHPQRKLCRCHGVQFSPTSHSLRCSLRTWAGALATQSASHGYQTTTTLSMASQSKTPHSTQHCRGSAPPLLSLAVWQSRTRWSSLAACRAK